MFSHIHIITGYVMSTAFKSFVRILDFKQARKAMAISQLEEGLEAIYQPLIGIDLAIAEREQRHMGLERDVLTINDADTIEVLRGILNDVSRFEADNNIKVWKGITTHPQLKLWVVRDYDDNPTTVRDIKVVVGNLNEYDALVNIYDNRDKILTQY